MPASAAIDEIEASVKEFLDSEEKRLTGQRDYLKALREKTGSAGLEASSTSAASRALLSSLSGYFADAE